MGDVGANILASSIALLVLLTVMAVVYMLWSQKTMGKKRKFFEELHARLAPKQEIMFCGGIFGHIEAIDGDRVTVRVRDGSTMDVSRYAIQSIVSE